VGGCGNEVGGRGTGTSEIRGGRSWRAMMGSFDGNAGCNQQQLVTDVLPGDYGGGEDDMRDFDLVGSRIRRQSLFLSDGPRDVSGTRVVAGLHI
jgi:hypothetical protein